MRLEYAVSRCGGVWGVGVKNPRGVWRWKSTGRKRRPPRQVVEQVYRELVQEIRDEWEREARDLLEAAQELDDGCLDKRPTPEPAGDGTGGAL